MAEVKDTLKQRGAIYGDYKRNVMLRHGLMQLIVDNHYKETGEEMDVVSQEYLWDIMNKIVRLSTTPTHVDSWQDIAGYSTLVKNQLIKESPNAN